jgi:uncharacterized protein YciI
VTRYYLAHLNDKQRHLMTEELIRDHVEYLRALRAAGTLSLCGPCADGSALMVLATSDEDQARAVVEGDPFSKVGYYRSRRIVEFQPADDSNNYHLEEVLDHLPGTA